ncbi:MAG: rhomboid family intramembrane serine protease [Hydrogenibacillus schlegelii]|uniref:Rhomboid family intramembrane serine protease n=1 Tax=Hydrogenibacillus schlegelii TaxID=1484 RepID=A0A947D081_HYDSH|nr:rhomboid family intramembrane serine protease [Hydrogenibacillus schlegelii]
MIFLRHESLRQYLRDYPVTSAFLAVAIAMFLWTVVDGSQFRPFLLYERYAFIPSAIAAGEWWRIFTATFVHQGWMHILFNLFWIYVFAPPLERYLGKGAFLGLLAAGVAGTAFLLLSTSEAAVGASGIDFALLGFYVFLLWRKPYWLDAQARSILVAVAVLGAVMTLVVPGISIAGHAGGFLGGFGYAALWNRRGR